MPLPKFIMEQFGKGSIWNCIFQFEKNLVFPICGESMEMFELYDKAFHTKQKMESSVFRQEIVRSIVKAIFYELRENICDDRLPLAIGNTQKEILFKKFMELLSAALQDEPLTFDSLKEPLKNSPCTVTDYIMDGWVNFLLFLSLFPFGMHLP